MPTATTMTFAGFSRDAIDFMAELALNNDRAWFQPRKAEFERLVREPFEALVAALAERFERRGIPLTADPARSVTRIYRDTRFSRDKSPYKDHVYASFGFADGGAVRYSGGYFNFQPGNMYVGGGMWMPGKEVVEAFRRRIVDDPDGVRAALEDPGFLAAFGPVKPYGDALKRVPHGYPADGPLADLLRCKSVVFGRSLADDDVTSPGLPDTLADAYGAATPVLRFLATLATAG